MGWQYTEEVTRKEGIELLCKAFAKMIEPKLNCKTNDQLNDLISEYVNDPDCSCEYWICDSEDYEGPKGNYEDFLKDLG